MRPPAGRPDAHRRRRDAAFVIPAFALLLLLPPFLNLFTIRRLLFGIPLEVVYIFTIWALLVVAAAVLSRLLPRPSNASAELPDRPLVTDPR